MALIHYLIAAGESLIHRFWLTNNGQELVDQVFNFSSQSAGGSKTNKNKPTTSNAIATFNNSWNVVGFSQQILSLSSLSSAPKWTLLDARNILEINTGKTIVCALLVSSCQQQQNQLSFLIVTTSCDQLVPLKYVKVSKSLQTSSFDSFNKPQLIDGPGIMWVHHSYLHVASSLYGPVCRLTLKSHSLTDRLPIIIDQLSPCCQEEENKPTSASVLFYHHFQGMSLVVGSRINSDGKKSFATVFSIPVDGFKNVDISRILPEPYASTVRHVQILECSLNEQSNKVSSEDSCLNIRLLAVTSEGYLTEFHSGKLIRCLYIRVGVSQMTAIPTTEGSSSFSSWFPVIVTNEHNVCIITPQLTKIHSIIDGFSHAFVDDFLRLGNSQLLLAQLPPTNEDPNLLTNHWLLTDLDSCHFESGPKIHRDEDDGHVVSQIGTVAECPEAVEKALSNKIQMDILTLEEKWQQLKIRNDFISECWQRFVAFQTTNRKPCPLPNEKKPGLMSFVEGSAQRVSFVKQTQDSYPVEILRLWQKIYGDHWIVGVDFRYSKSKFLKKASLLITSSENITFDSATTPYDSVMYSSEYSTLCGQSFFWNNNTISSASTKDDSTVTCALHPFPLLTVHPTRKFLVFLSLHTISEELQKRHILTHPCGTIDFGMQQVIGDGSSRLQTEQSLPFYELPHNACLLNAVQNRCKVDIRSKKSQLTFLEKHLKSFEELSWNPFLKCFLYRSNCGPLMDARLTIDKQQPHRCLVSIFVREVSCIPTLIHFLYSRLPEDVIILPVVPVSVTKVNNWLTQLQTYLQNLSKQFYSLDDQRMFDDQLTAGELEQQLSADLLDQIRHECEAKKRKITDRHVIDVGKCQPLITLLEKEQFLLDSLAVIFS